MRRAGTLTAITGCHPRDHVCWGHGGTTPWPEAVLPYLAEGAARGERLLYVADRPVPSLHDDLAALPGRDAMLASGQLQVAPLANADGDTATLGPAAQIAWLRSESSAAGSEGFTGLRLAAEITAMATTPEDAHRCMGYELAVDALVAAAPVTVMCGYDIDRIGAEAARAIAFVHPLRLGGVEDLTAALHAAGDGRWRLRGEVDTETRDALYAALAALPATEPAHLDLSDLEFIDVAGARALAALAVRLAPAGGVVLHDPPEQLAWMLDTWGGTPGLRVAGR